MYCCPMALNNLSVVGDARLERKFYMGCRSKTGFDLRLFRKVKVFSSFCNCPSVKCKTEASLANSSKMSAR